MRFWIIYILVQILFFGDCLGQCNFKTFLCQPTMLEDIFPPLPPPPPRLSPNIRRLSTALNIPTHVTRLESFLGISNYCYKQLTYLMYEVPLLHNVLYSRYQVPFHFWWTELALKLCEIPIFMKKYSDTFSFSAYFFKNASTFWE